MSQSNDHKAYTLLFQSDAVQTAVLGKKPAPT